MFVGSDMRHSVKIFSRIGELIQGILPDGSPFLVSGLPSRTLFSEVTLEEGVGVVLPPKALRAVEYFQAEYAPHLDLSGLCFRLQTNIPPGKGLSSSSADILGVLSVLNKALQTGLSNAQLYTLAVRIEPTDPCLHEEIVLFRQQEGRAEQLLTLPPLSMVWFDTAPDRQVDTVTLLRSYNKEAPAFFDSLLRSFLQAAAEQDYPVLLDCITQSALYNQSILALPHFEVLYRLALRMKAGLLIAHSGTIAGLLASPDREPELLNTIREMDWPYSSLQTPAI